MAKDSQPSLVAGPRLQAAGVPHSAVGEPAQENIVVGVGATPAGAAEDHRRKRGRHDGSHLSCYPCQQLRMRAGGASPLRRTAQALSDERTMRDLRMEEVHRELQMPVLWQSEEQALLDEAVEQLRPSNVRSRPRSPRRGPPRAGAADGRPS